MLTDKDKSDLMLFMADTMTAARENTNTKKLVIERIAAILVYVMDHPDVCAAEVNEYLSSSPKNIMEDIDRLRFGRKPNDL